MNFLKLSLLSVFALIYSKSFVNSEDTSTLQLLQIVHRHGDRTPISFYPNDPYKSVDHWPDGLGELTPRGKQRMYKFGQQLRERYKEYLGNTPKNIQIRSSSANRCIESAAAVVAGMYPPENRWVWSKNDPIANYWQPVAIQTVLKSTDGMLVTNSDCPAADAAYEEVMKSKEVQNFMESNKEFIEKVGNQTGVKYTKLRELDFLYDTLHIETSFEEPLAEPKWLRVIGNDTLERLKKFELKAFEFDWSSKKVQRLRGGLILQELLLNMRNASDLSKQNNMKKVYSYSTHDTLLVTLLQALGLYNGIPPNYGSALLFELHTNSNSESFVKLFYANLVPNLRIDPLKLTICGADQTTCELNKFADSIKQFIPNDWEKECKLV
jgi:hypothetical protein